jgi:hypothetical protein
MDVDRTGLLTYIIRETIAWRCGTGELRIIKALDMDEAIRQLKLGAVVGLMIDGKVVSDLVWDDDYQCFVETFRR